MDVVKKNSTLKVLMIALIFIHFIDSSIYSSELSYKLKFLVTILITIEWIIRNRFRITFKLYSAPFYFMIYTLLFIIFLSLLNTEQLSEAIIQGLSYVLLLVISFFIVPDYVQTKENYISFLKIFYIMFFLLLLINIILSQFTPEVTFTNFSNRLRYRGVFNNPNSLGSYSLLGVIISISLMLLTGKKYYLYSNILFILLIYYSDSKTSLILSIIFVTSIIIMWKLLKRKVLMRTIFLLFLLLLFICLVLGIIWAAFNSNSTLLEQLDQLSNGRISRSITALSEFSSVDYLVGKGVASRVTNPHNALINTLVEIGLLGVICVYSLIVGIAVYALTSLKKSKDLFIQKLMIICLSMLLTYFVFGFSESLLITLGNIISIFMWTNFGIHMRLAHKFQ